MLAFSEGYHEPNKIENHWYMVLTQPFSGSQFHQGIMLHTRWFNTCGLTHSTASPPYCCFLQPLQHWGSFVVKVPLTRQLQALRGGKKNTFIFFIQYKSRGWGW